MEYKRYIATGVFVVSFLTNSGFILNVKNLKANTASSIDITTNASTVYEKDGISASALDLLVGQKVIVSGILDETANILNAKTIKIVTNKKNL
jgi:hypothetical protein